MKIEFELSDADTVLAFIDRLDPVNVGPIPTGLVVVADVIETNLRSQYHAAPTSRRPQPY